MPLGNQVSSFPSENALLQMFSGQSLQRSQENALLMQQHQQQIGMTDQDSISRAALGLLSVGAPGEAGEAERAAAYPTVVAQLQRNGLARNAPTQYPGFKALQGFANMGMPVAQQYQMGLGPTPPGLAEALKGVYGPQASTGTSNSFAGGIAGMESGGNAGAENPLWPVAKGGPAGPHQFIPGTWQGFVMAHPEQFKGMSAQQVMAARTDPALSEQATNWYAGENAKALQAAGVQPSPANLGIAHALGAGGAIKVLSASDNTPLSQVILETIPQNPQYGRMTVGDLKRKYAGLGPVGGQQQASADSGGGNGPLLGAFPGGVQRTPGGDATPAPYQVAGPPVAPPGGVGTAPAPAQAPPWMPQPAAPPVQQQQGPPPATGVNSPQFLKAMQLERQAAVIASAPGAKFNQQAQAAIKYLTDQAALYRQADSVIVDPNTGIQTHTLTGAQSPAAAPNAHYVWDPKLGAQVDTTATHPATFPRPPNLVTTPDGNVIQSSRVGGDAQVVYTTSAEQRAQQAAAQAEGSATGAATAKALPQIAEHARAAGAAEGNIDMGLAQLDRAKAGGINTGYFAGALTKAASAAKSLGIPPQLIGIDPSAIGDIQTAQKTLAVVSGAILQQILGKSDITDAKIDAFINAQPGITNDPDAVRRILAWARSQFTYEREMGKAAMDEARQHEGRLPPGWQAGYYADHGFAPIYNPSTGEMQQPDGASSGRTSPSPAAAAASGVATVKTDADFHALPSGTVFTDPNGQQRRKP